MTRKRLKLNKDAHVSARITILRERLFEHLKYLSTEHNVEVQIFGGFLRRELRSRFVSSHHKERRISRYSDVDILLSLQEDRKLLVSSLLKLECFRVEILPIQYGMYDTNGTTQKCVVRYSMKESLFAKSIYLKLDLVVLERPRFSDFDVNALAMDCASGAISALPNLELSDILVKISKKTCSLMLFRPSCEQRPVITDLVLYRLPKMLKDGWNVENVRQQWCEHYPGGLLGALGNLKSDEIHFRPKGLFIPWLETPWKDDF
jgi:predicted nucleotidyltransferase